MVYRLPAEGKSRLSILVIEDDPQYAGSAFVALSKHDVALASTLGEAKELLARGKFDFILSDVHVPAVAGEAPKAIVSEIASICYSSGIPACFVTKADHHGLLDLGDEGYVTLKAITTDHVATAILEASRYGGAKSEKEFFRALGGQSENIRSSDKTPEIWAKALDMARNAALKPTPIGAAIRKVRSIGLDVVMQGGLPKVVPPRK